MEASGYITLLLIVINVIVSYKGFRDTAFFYRYAFSPDKVLVMKNYKVLVTAGFLHAGWVHLFFNMFSLYAFSQALEPFMGSIKYLVIYFASLICGNLFVMLVNRYVANHTVVGASGAVSGLIFATIALFPGVDISLFILPAIPAWLFGMIFVAYSIWGIRSGKDNIAHEAHLAGALAGLIIACIMFPDALIENYVTVLLILVPS
ncbi:MAG TPA: rhomboid family intramembrane serine protease, partial [Chitinophagaceae bacterium]|nr:rhomboid family intramembrane serine protease [Chitinophagaceae bacterium]